MTIAIGILAKDGVVLGCDSEVTYGDFYMKSRKVKVGGAHHIGVEAVRQALVVGAGNSFYIDRFVQELDRKTLRDHRLMKEDALDVLGDALRDFYDKHVAALGLSLNERPSFDLLIAYVEGTQRARFFQTQHNAMFEHQQQWECCEFAAIGAGEATADFRLRQLLSNRPRLTLQEAALLAAYVIYQTKETVPGCGKDTDIVAMSGQTLMRIGTNLAGELDHKMRVYSEQLEPMVFRSVVSGTRSMHRTTDAMERLRQKFSELAASLRFTPLASPPDPAGSTDVASDQPPSQESPVESDES